MKCVHCQKEVDDNNYRFCPYCGCLIYHDGEEMLKNLDGVEEINNINVKLLNIFKENNLLDAISIFNYNEKIKLMLSVKNGQNYFKTNLLVAKAIKENMDKLPIKKAYFELTLDRNDNFTVDLKCPYSYYNEKSHYIEEDIFIIFTLRTITREEGYNLLFEFGTPEEVEKIANYFTIKKEGIETDIKESTQKLKEVEKVLKNIQPFLKEE